MTTRDDIVTLATSFLGYLEGPHEQNEFSAWLGRPAEFWCADFVTAVYAKAGLALPAMQPGCATGFAGVQSGFGWAQQHGSLRDSTDAEPGDLIGFQWAGLGLTGDPMNMHVELCTHRDDTALHTIGGNSGPSVDGRDGVHEHTWVAGSDIVIGAIDTGRLVTFAEPDPAPLPQQPRGGGRPLVPTDPNPWAPHRLIRVTNHPAVWQLRLNGHQLIKAHVPSPVELAGQLRRGQTSQLLLDTPANNRRLERIPTVAWA